MTAKLRTFGTRLKTFDTRTVKPPEKKADAELQTADHRRRREEACERAGWRCEWVEDGRRCERSRANGDTMVGDHIHERKDGGSAAGRLQCLCIAHNTLKGNIARRDRAQSSFREE